MLAGISTRGWQAGLEPVGAARRTGRHVDEQVRDQPPVRRGDRDRAGRAARRDLLDVWTWSR